MSRRWIDHYEEVLEDDRQILGEDELSERNLMIMQTRYMAIQARYLAAIADAIETIANEGRNRI